MVETPSRTWKHKNQFTKRIPFKKYKPHIYYFCMVFSSLSLLLPFWLGTHLHTLWIAKYKNLSNGWNAFCKLIFIFFLLVSTIYFTIIKLSPSSYSSLTSILMYLVNWFSFFSHSFHHIFYPHKTISTILLVFNFYFKLHYSNNSTIQTTHSTNQNSFYTAIYTIYWPYGVRLISYPMNDHFLAWRKKKVQKQENRDSFKNPILVSHIA